MVIRMNAANTHQLARMLGLKPIITPVINPQTNGWLVLFESTSSYGLYVAPLAYLPRVGAEYAYQDVNAWCGNNLNAWWCRMLPMKSGPWNLCTASRLMSKKHPTVQCDRGRQPRWSMYRCRLLPVRITSSPFA